MKKGLSICLFLAAVSCVYSASTTVGACKCVLIIDAYARGTQTVAQATSKYTTYWNDVKDFYLTKFSLEMNLASLYVEPGGYTFSGTFDNATLLTDFKNAVNGGSLFPGIPTDACVYHLVTGRWGLGIGGLAWVGTACGGASALNKGYSVDQQGTENSELVIRRIIHEIGHNLNGNHPDAYKNQNPAYSCNTGDSDIGNRILRNANDESDAPLPVPETGPGAVDAQFSPLVNSSVSNKIEGVEVLPYTYLSNSAFVTECATKAMQSSLSGFECLWTSYPTSPYITFWDNSGYSGTSKRIDAHKGIYTCYNVIGFYDRAASFKAVGTTRIAVWLDSDCRGTAWVWNNVNPMDINYVSSGLDNKIKSFMFS